MDASIIENEIKTAFKDVKLDGGISLRQAEVIDDYGEGVTKEEFARLPQQDITDNWMLLTVEVLNDYCYIPHLDAKGFRYYIPAYILGVLNSYGSFDCASSTLSALYPKKGDSWSHRIQQYSLLNTQQRSAIAHFLQMLPDVVVLDYEDSKKVKMAIHNFWQ